MNERAAPHNRWLAALDPGRNKCGLVRCDASGPRIDAAAILDPAACRTTLMHWQAQGELDAVVLGNGTGSRSWQTQLSELGIAVHLVDERGTTLAARQRYWQLWPPQGWRRLIPAGLRLPPRDLDDVAAQLLLERHLGRPLPRSSQALGA